MYFFYVSLNIIEKGGEIGKKMHTPSSLLNKDNIIMIKLLLRLNLQEPEVRGTTNLNP